KNYGAKRNLSDIKYIVIHYTGNDGDTSENNGKYFKNNVVKASAHCFVDDDVVIKSVPLSNVAYAVGGCYTTKGDAGNYYKKCTNANSISIEMCDTVRNGKVMVTAKTRAKTIELVKYYMKKYNIPADHVIRHWDVNGKECPAYYVGKNNKLWEDFLNEIGAATSCDSTKIYGKVNTKRDPLMMRSKASSTGKVICKVPKGEKVQIITKGKSWHKVKYAGKTGYCSAKYIKML
ncbi:N-acetylmuramoyl-L-alanine amidase, partial [Anaerostipes sp.]|uniref:N-acetylmuramoyl-L-alanine amidase n=1 Tax=Anaerostipes sp. TaxID=1872530 RepID=UPI002585899C